MIAPTEPTSDQCNGRSRAADFDGHPAYACWYPQMGGYVGKAVAVIIPPDEPDSAGGCFDVFVWHDGTFPFADDYENGVSPVRLHHCSPSQFVAFGEFVASKQREGESS